MQKQQTLEKPPYNNRTNIFDHFLTSNALYVNNNDTPTWHARGLSSITDYTLTSNLDITNWKVDNELNFSDHSYITYEIPTIPSISSTTYTVKETDKDKLKELYTNIPILLPYDNAENTKKNAITIQQWIEKAVKEATIENINKTRLFYWNKTLAKLKAELKYLQRQKHNALKRKKQSH